MPDLRQLRAFLAVAEQLSFTRAAERLHLQQQSVSKTIRQLEDELGVELLERTTREVRLTPAGRALAADGAHALAAAEAAFERARQIGTGSLGRVRVGVTPAISALDRAEVIAAVRAQDPGASVAFYDARTTEVPRRLADRELDVAIVRSRAGDSDRVHAAELRPTPAVICVTDDHPLAPRRELHIADLHDQRLLFASPPGTPFTDMILAQFTGAGVPVTAVESQVTGSSSILSELAGTQTIGLRPDGTELPPGVVAIPIPDLRLPLFLLWPAGLPSLAVSAIRQAMADG